MAITAQNMSYNTSGPAFSFQQVAFGGRDNQELAYRGQVTFTGDGATTSATVNWIDGSQTPFFNPGNPPTAVAPKMVLAQANGGTAAATISVASVTSITTTGALLTFSAAPANLATLIVSIVIFPY